PLVRAPRSLRGRPGQGHRHPPLPRRRNDLARPARHRPRLLRGALPLVHRGPPPGGPQGRAAGAALLRGPRDRALDVGGAVARGARRRLASDPCPRAQAGRRPLMLELIHDSGWGAWLTLILAVAGLAATLTVGRRSGRP